MDTNPTNTTAGNIGDNTEPAAGRQCIEKNYPGAKAGAGVFQTLINLMPPHRTYVELFLGSGQLFRRKQPAEINIGVEIDPLVTRQWHLKENGRLEIIQMDAMRYLATADSVNSADTLIYADQAREPAKMPIIAGTTEMKSIFSDLRESHAATANRRNASPSNGPRHRLSLQQPVAALAFVI